MGLAALRYLVGLFQIVLYYLPEILMPVYGVSVMGRLYGPPVSQGGIDRASANPEGIPVIGGLMEKARPYTSQEP